MPFDDDLMDALQPILPAGSGGAMVIPTVGGARAASDPSLLTQPGGDGWSQVTTADPTVAEWIGDHTTDALRSAGVDPYQARVWGDRAQTGFEWTPAGAAETAGRALGAGQYFNAAVNALGVIPEGGKLAAAGVGGLGKLAMFLGPKSALFDSKMAALAEEMMANGATRDEIWKATGTDKIAGTMFGPRGEPMQEISDVGAHFKHPDEYIDKAPALTAGDVFNHPQGFEAYPQLADTEFNWNRSGGAEGSYSRGWPEDNIPSSVSISPNARDKPSTMLHETFTHGVQDIENWPKGGNTNYLNPGTPAWDIYQDRLEAIRTPLTPGGFAATGMEDPAFTYDDYLKQHYDGLKDPMQARMLDRVAQDEAVREAYHRSTGEAQARNVQSRKDMTLEDLKATPPWMTEDVPTDQQIPTYLNDGPAMSSPVFVAMRDVPGFDPDALAAAVPVVGGKPHPISSLMLKSPMADVTAAYQPMESGLLARKPFDFESVPMGSTFVPVQGDTTAAGRQILGVNGAEFTNPVDQYGGSEYMRGPQQIADNSFWAVGQSDATKLSRHLNSFLGDGPVYPTHLSMSAQSGDFSAQTTKTLREMHAANPMSDDAIDKFNKAMQEPKGKDFPGVPGFDLRKIDDDWMANSPGWVRSKLAKLMDTKTFQDLGAPDVAAARMAITEPELFGKGAGASGFAISRMDNPATVLANPQIPHYDYPGQLAGGSYEGGTHPIPPNIFWKDFFATRPADESLENSMYALKRKNTSQVMTPEFLDHIMSYQEQQRNLDWLLRGGS